jgi:hypothetical protein
LGEIGELDDLSDVREVHVLTDSDEPAALLLGTCVTASMPLRQLLETKRSTERQPPLLVTQRVTRFR